MHDDLTPRLTADQLEFMRLARDAQSGNIPAARALGPLIERIAAKMEEPMQQLTADDDPTQEQGPSNEDGPPDRARAYTLTDILVEQAIGRNRLCPNCEGPHWGWQCPEIAAQLKRPEQSWKDVALGRELCRMRWRNFKAFVALLTSIPTAHLVIYAESYIAFIRDYNAHSDLTIKDVLGQWMRMISDEGDPGPAAPALRMVA